MLLCQSSKTTPASLLEQSPPSGVACLQSAVRIGPDSLQSIVNASMFEAEHHATVQKLTLNSSRPCQSQYLFWVHRNDASDRIQEGPQGPLSRMESAKFLLTKNQSRYSKQLIPQSKSHNAPANRILPRVSFSTSMFCNAILFNGKQ